MDDRTVAANPLPRSTLQRALADRRLDWFGAEPGRLAVFLRVAGCPDEQVGAWLAKLTELGAEVPGPVPVVEPVAAAKQPSPPAPRTRRRARIVVTVAVATAGVTFLLVLASYAQFYGALGFELGTMPLRPAGVARSTAIALVLVAATATLVATAFVTGSLLAPWTVHTRAATPISVLSIVLPATGFLALAAAVPRWYAEVLAVVLLLVGCGCQFRLIATQRPLHWLTGWSLGLPIAAALWLLARTTRDWSGSVWWVVAMLLAAALVLVIPLRWWTLQELRRDGLDRPDPTRPAALLTSAWSDLFGSVGAVVRSPLPGREARRLVIGLTSATLVAPMVVLVLLAYLLSLAAHAGAVTREYGYVPPGQGPPLLWEPPVAPAIVTLRQPGTDPAGVCGSDPPWAASVIDRDRHGSWVLLRPADTGGPAEVGPQLVWLDAADYIVRTVAGPAAPDGAPWNRPACAP